jgi:hypothetical protein
LRALAGLVSFSIQVPLDFIMVQAVIGALRVNLGIDSAQFQDGLKKAEASTNKFAKAMKVGFAAAAAAATAALGGLALSLKSTLSAVDDIARQAQVSNTTFESFQRLAYAARTVGIESDKLADIFKDVNDRVGDFAATGGGPMADFFEKIAPRVGVTAEAFKNLSGPQALQLYYDSLKKAGVNQQEMTFYLEAMASDVTALIPLLEKGGEAFRKLGENASVISEEDGNRLRAFNQSMRDMGQAISDVALAAIASLSSALMLAANGFDAFSSLLRQAIHYLPTLAEYAAVAGGALALMFSPAILAAVGNLTVAISVGLVGAVRLLTAAIIANPIGALAVAIATAVTAIYHFRDEIQKAIGVDVVGIVKDAANLVINSFRAAFEDIKFVWSEFGNIMGAAVIGGVNIAIRAINGLIQSAAEGVDWLIEKLNKVPGVTIDPLGGVSALFEIDNPYAGALSDAVGTHNAKIQAIMSSDPIGALADSFTASTPAVVNFNNALSNTNSQLEDMAGEGGGGKGGKSKLKSAKDGIKDAAAEMERFIDSVASGMSNIFQGLIDGSKGVKETIADLLKQLSSMLMNEGFKALMGGMVGGGGLFSGIGKLFGFARGGTIMPGGAGGIDSQLVAFRKSPNERVDITKPGQSLANGRQEVTVSGVFVDDNGVIKAQVTRMGAQAAQAGATIAVRQVNQGLPSMIADAQARKM